MKPYFYRGTISPALFAHIAANAGKFDAAMRVSVEAFGGKLLRCHLSAESSDPIGFLMFPDDCSARAWSAFYASQDGVLSSKINRLLDEQDLGKMHRLIKDNKSAATGHRQPVA
jgi:hypothetical protein